MIIADYPLLKLDHLRRLTDGTGLLEHAIYGVPRPGEGYSVDDNARALQAVLRHHALFGDPEVLEMARRYLALLVYAQREDGRFHNDLQYDRTWSDEVGAEDTQGRAAWALAEVAATAPLADLRGPAHEFFERLRPWLRGFGSPRTRALVILAVREGLRGQGDEGDLRQVLRDNADALLGIYRAVAQPDWPWFEDRLTYGNALVSHGLLAAWEMEREARYLECARTTLDWLLEVVFPDGETFHPVGQDGWYVRGRARAHFDQQPIEAQVTVEACLEAHRLLGEERYLRRAHSAFEWFLGRNVHGLSPYDEITGGCRDGLTREGLNENQGAEATLAYLLAYLAILQAAQGERRAVSDAARRSTR